jgi:hypothetical protein
MQASMLAGSGDACQAASDLPAAVEARQASRVLCDLGWPDLAGVGARLEQAGQPSPGKLTIRLPPRRFGERQWPPAGSPIAIPTCPRHSELVTCRDIASTPPAHRRLAW